MTYPNSLTLYFDGSCAPTNPNGWATYGWLLKDADTKAKVDEGRGIAALPSDPWSTNNYAEWCGLGRGLAALLAAGWKGGMLTIKGDSQLVCYQLSQRWKCNKPALKKLKDRCIAILKQLSPSAWQAEWIPREQNAEADALAWVAYQECSGNGKAVRTDDPTPFAPSVPMTSNPIHCQTELPGIIHWVLMSGESMHRVLTGKHANLNVPPNAMGYRFAREPDPTCHPLASLPPSWPLVMPPLGLLNPK